MRQKCPCKWLNIKNGLLWIALLQGFRPDERRTNILQDGEKLFMLKNIASISWVDLIKIKPQMAQEPPLHLWLCWPLTDSWKFFFIIPWFAPAVFGRFWIRFLFSDPPKIVWRRDHPNYVTDRTLPLLQWAPALLQRYDTCLLGRMQHLGLWSNEVAYPHGATGTYMMRNRWSSLRLQ